MRPLTLAILVLLAPGLAAPALADPVVCEKTITKEYSSLNRKTLKSVAKCLDQENVGKLPGPCPDTVTAAKLMVARQKTEAKVAAACSIVDATALGFGGCGFGDPLDDSAVESTCRALPISQPAEFATCLSCWQQADQSEFLAVAYASHAFELCNGLPDLTSTVCSAGGCSGAPQSSPDQRDLGDTGENDCQKGIGNAAIKYFLTVRKIYEKCALAGGTRNSCRNDPVLEARIDKAKDKQASFIEARCGNRDPLPNTPFCCKTTGNQCMAAADRATCELGGGQVQEGKVCGGGSTCEPTPGGQTITWWSSCERRDCQGYPVTLLEDLHDCTEDRAEEIVEAMLCTQFPSNGQLDWPCP